MSPLRGRRIPIRPPSEHPGRVLLDVNPRLSPTETHIQLFDNISSLHSVTLQRPARATRRRTPLQRQIRRAIKGQGATWKVISCATDKERTHLIPVSGKGFGVSLFGHEEQNQSLTESLLRAYIRKHRRQLSRPDVHLGVWLCDGIWYYDLSIIVKGRALAEELGRRHRQLSIWDFGKQEAISL